MYVIKMWTHNIGLCDDNISKTGTIITSTNASVRSLESLSKAVSRSSMEKGKLYAHMLLTVMTPDTSIILTTYTQYCNQSYVVDWCKLCTDDTQKLYDEAAYVKNTFNGMYLANLDDDDSQNLCGCQKFPATNAFLDGWDGVAHTKCEKIDRDKSTC